MKIAQIMYTGFGGLSTMAFSLITADQDRSRVWVTAFIGDQPIDPSYPSRCAELGVEWEDVNRHGNLGLTHSRCTSLSF